MLNQSEDPAANPLNRDTSTVESPTMQEEVTCPLCEYNLRGLSEPRCPGCGYKFTWDEITDKTRRLHPYLFEHHPERNVWSFARTAFAALWPRGFWTTLHPAQPSRPR